jgi:hypothetical protein
MIGTSCPARRLAAVITLPLLWAGSVGYVASAAAQDKQPAPAAAPGRGPEVSAGAPTAADSVRAGALLQTIRTDLHGSELTMEQIQGAERARAQLDAMSEGLDAYKVAANDALGMLFRAADLDTGIAFHARAVMALAPHLDSADCVRLAHPLIRAWRNLAEVEAGHGQPKQALALLRGAPAALPRVPDVARELGTEVARYEMIGHPAPRISAPYWFGAPAGTKMVDPGAGGAVTIIEETAWWCAACNRSYPAVLRIQHRYGDKVHVLLATSLMGRFRADTDLVPNAELAKLRDYFAVENALPYPVAVAENPGEEDHDAISNAYHVYAIPQVVVVDAHGIVRHILLGWDPGNDDRLDRAVSAALSDAPLQ